MNRSSENKRYDSKKLNLSNSKCNFEEEDDDDDDDELSVEPTTSHEAELKYEKLD